MSQGPIAGFLIAHPAVTLSIFAGGFLLLAWTVFVEALGRSPARSATRVSNRFESLERSVDELRAAIGEPSPKAPPEGLRGENRARALAMIERGASLESVANEFGVSAGDLELLMKVERILSGLSA